MSYFSLTDSTVEAAFRRQEYGVKRKDSKHLHKEKSKLHKINWHRIILDEAHNIKDRSSNTARAVVSVHKSKSVYGGYTQTLKKIFFCAVQYGG